MKKLLFVDDEVRVLRGLQRMLFKKRGEWAMRFVESGEAAFTAMAEDPADVVVSDMRMPGMDGADLLERIKADYPGTVRIILSGHTEQEAAVRALPFAHQFLSKPCDSEMIVEAVEQAVALQTLATGDAARSVVGGMDQLPSAPHVYAELTAVLADPTGSIDQVKAIIAQDAGMSGNVLHMVNSAFFGLPQKTTDIGTAVAMLGGTMLSNLVLSAHLFESFPIDSQAAKYFSIEQFQTHCALVGRAASNLDRRASWSRDAFAAGLLHDAGRLILAARMPEEFASIMEESQESGRPDYVIEQEHLGVHHAHLGAHLLSMWGLPFSVVDAVGMHHSPASLIGREFGMAHAVFVANYLIGPGGDPDHTPDEPTVALLATEAIASRLDEWRTVVEESVAVPAEHP